MYCMSYNDLQWGSALLEPLRYTIRDGALQRLKSPGEAPEAVCTDLKRRTASLGMPAGQGRSQTRDMIRWRVCLRRSRYTIM